MYISFTVFAFQTMNFKHCSRTTPCGVGLPLHLYLCTFLWSNSNFPFGNNVSQIWSLKSSLICVTSFSYLRVSNTLRHTGNNFSDIWNSLCIRSLQPTHWQYWRVRVFKWCTLPTEGIPYNSIIYCNTFHVIWFHLSLEQSFRRHQQIRDFLIKSFYKLCYLHKFFLFKLRN